MKYSVKTFLNIIDCGTVADQSKAIAGLTVSAILCAAEKHFLSPALYNSTSGFSSSLNSASIEIKFWLNGKLNSSSLSD